jgi:hypothetical protein
MKGQTVSWINEHKNVGRVAVLILLLVAIMGPWTYSSDGTPPAEWCRAPNILLENGRCVRLVSGLEVLTFMVGAFLSMSVGLVTGATVLPDRSREFLITLRLMVGIFLLVLPFFTTLFRIWGRDSRRLRVFHLMAWGLAAVLGLLLAVAVFDPGLRLGQLWGIWLYIGLAASVLILKVLMLVAGRRLSQG